MNARQDHLNSVVRDTTADELSVEHYDEKQNGDRYKVEHVDAPALSGYYIVADDGEISPGRVTRPSRPHRYHEAAKKAIRQNEVKQ